MSQKTCLVKVEKDKWESANFIGVFQFSNVVEASPFVGGHPGGVIAYPVAVIEINGEIREVKVSNVKFEGAAPSESYGRDLDGKKGIR